MTKFNLSLAASVGLCLLSMTATAGARELTVTAQAQPEDRLIERVGFQDLDLTNDSDIGALNKRVRGAVRRVCAPLDEVITVHLHGTCTTVAWNGAEPQIGLAVARARDIAQFGTSSIAPVAISVSAAVR